MHLLLIGGGGHLGSIVRPALEREHTCRYLDTRPIPDAEDRTIVADVNDDDAMRAALDGVDCALYMALGAGEPFAMPGDRRGPHRYQNLEACMSVNVLGVYRMLMHGLDMGVRRYVHASTLSVYKTSGRPPVDETYEPNAWRPYGLSKRLAEQVCYAATQHDPEVSLLALRLVRPTTEEDWAERLAAQAAEENAGEAGAARDTATSEQTGRKRRGRGYPLGPEDVRRLYLAAVQFDTPGFHAIQTAGDLEGHDVPWTRAQELIGWKPEGR